MKRHPNTVDNTQPWDQDKVRFQSDGPARPPWWQAQIDDPVYVGGADTRSMRDDDYVIGLVFDGKPKAYPLWILDYYHIVNDRQGTQPFVLFSCDRCQTGDAWLTTCGAHDLFFYFGGIHNCTLVGADANTNSKWLIADGVSVHGPLRGQLLQRVPTYHCTWGEWKAAHPNTLLLDPPKDPAHRDQRHGHGSSEYYARPGLSPLFPRTLSGRPDLQLDESAMVLIVSHDEHQRLYAIDDCKRAGGVIHDQLGDASLVMLAGPRGDSFWMGGYYATVDGQSLSFENQGAYFIDRETHSRWNVEGRCLGGALEGKQLPLAHFAFMRWHGWAWGHIHNDLYQLKERKAVPEAEFGPLLDRLRGLKYVVEVDREVINLERPNEAESGLLLRLNGDQFRLFRFASVAAAIDYEVHQRHCLRSSKFVLESEPALDLQFADEIHGRLKPENQIPWSALVAPNSEHARIITRALRETWPELPNFDLTLTGLLGRLRGKGYDVEIGKWQLVDGMRTGRWIIEPARSCLRVGCLNAAFGKINQHPFILYKFESEAAAQAYLDHEEKHATRIDTVVFRDNPDGQYFLKTGFGMLPDEQISWSKQFQDEAFIAAVRDCLYVKPNSAAYKQYDAPPPVVIDSTQRYHARVQTEKGEFVIELAAQDAPNTVNNFVFLARDGYYDGTTFHMVQPGQYAQGGDPKGDGKGFPGYRFPDEFSTNLKHDVGVVTMANAGGPNSNGCQFIVLLSPMTWLDGRNTAFGRVVEGLDVVHALTPRDCEWEWPDPPPGDRILRISIEQAAS